MRVGFPPRCSTVVATSGQGLKSWDPIEDNTKMTMNMMNADTNGSLIFTCIKNHIASFVVGEKAMPAYQSLAEEMGFADAVPETLAGVHAKNGALDELERFIEEARTKRERRILKCQLRYGYYPVLPQYETRWWHESLWYFTFCGSSDYGRNLQACDLPHMTVVELKRICRLNRIKRHSRLRRRELIQVLLKRCGSTGAQRRPGR